MEIPAKELWTAIGTVTGATIAAGVTFLTATLSKDAKISEFRLAWMDTVRTEIAEICARRLQIQQSSKRLRSLGKTEPDVRREVAEDLLSVKRNIAMLRMRLDPSKHQPVIYLLIKVDNKDWGERSPQSASSDLLTEFQDEGRNLLFAEWQRVKKGEGAYKLIRPVSKIMFLLFLAILFMLVAIALARLRNQWG